MRILLVAPPGHLTEQIVRGFQQNHCEVMRVSDRTVFLSPFFRFENAFLWRVIRKFGHLKRINNALFGKYLLRCVDRYKPDILFANKGTIIKPDILRMIRSRGVKTANWFPENTNREPYLSWFLKVYKDYSFFFHFDSEFVERYNSGDSNLIYMPLAVDPDAYRVDVSDEDMRTYGCDICFIGAPYPERQAMLELIADLNLKIFGWSGWRNTSLAKYYYGSLDIKEMAKAYRCAKICINMNLEPPTKGVNQKTFEIPAAKGFQLSDFRSDIAGIFTVGKEIEIFRSPQELREKVLWYLNHEQERATIAQAGHERLLREHTLRSRIASMLTIMTS